MPSAVCTLIAHKANIYSLLAPPLFFFHGEKSTCSHVGHRLPRDMSSNNVAIPIGDLSHFVWDGKEGDFVKVWLYPTV